MMKIWSILQFVLTILKLTLVELCCTNSEWPQGDLVPKKLRTYVFREAIPSQHHFWIAELSLYRQVCRKVRGTVSLLRSTLRHYRKWSHVLEGWLCRLATSSSWQDQSSYQGNELPFHHCPKHIQSLNIFNLSFHSHYNRLRCHVTLSQCQNHRKWILWLTRMILRANSLSWRKVTTEKMN